jgi:hypothetical protein
LVHKRKEELHMSSSGKVSAMAITKPNNGKDDELIQVLRELSDFLRQKGYGTDRLYRDAKTHHYINVREWDSEQQAMTAHQDPELHRFWARLGKISKTVKIYERLEQISI